MMHIKDYSSKVLTIGCHFCPPKGGVAIVLKSYKDSIYNPFKFVANSKGNYFLNIWYLLKSLVQCEYIYHVDKDIEIVHIHTASYNSFKRSTLYIRQAKRYGKKVVCHVHGGAFRNYRNTCPEFVDNYLRKCDAIVALSDGWKKFFIEEVGLKNVFVVNNTIEKPKPKPVMRDDKFHLFFLGLIIEAKGIFDLLDVLKEHKAEWINHLVLHIGGNGKVDELRQKINEYGIADMVIYEGWVSGSRKAELFCLADAFILPSYTEGVPISILEALSYGVPVLSTHVGGIPEIIKPLSNGILFNAGDRFAINNAIQTLINSRELCLRIKENNLRESISYLPENICTQLEIMYNEI